MKVNCILWKHYYYYSHNYASNTVILLQSIYSIHWTNESDPSKPNRTAPTSRGPEPWVSPRVSGTGGGWVRMGSDGFWVKRGSLTQQLKLGNLNLIMVIMARMTQLVHNSWMMIDNDMDKHVDKWLIWSVVWNMNGLFFHSVGNFIIPTDELHHFSEG